MFWAHERQPPQPQQQPDHNTGKPDTEPTATACSVNSLLSASDTPAAAARPPPAPSVTSATQRTATTSAVNNSNANIREGVPLQQQQQQPASSVYFGIMDDNGPPTNNNNSNNINGRPPPSTAAVFSSYRSAVGGGGSIADMSTYDPWRFALRALAVTTVASAVAIAVWRFTPPVHVLIADSAVKFLSRAGDAVGVARVRRALSGSIVTTASTTTFTHRDQVVAVSLCEVARVAWNRHPVKRAFVVTVAPTYAFYYATWLLDQSAVVLRGLFEALRPLPSSAPATSLPPPQDSDSTSAVDPAAAVRAAVRRRVQRRRRLRQWHHVAVEAGLLTVGATLAGGAVLACRWTARHLGALPVADVVGDLARFVEQQQQLQLSPLTAGSSSAGASSSHAPRPAASSQRVLDAANAAALPGGTLGAASLSAAVRMALPLVPSAYPDVTASLVCYGVFAASTVRRGLRSVWQQFIEHRAVVLFRANDEAADDEDGDGEGTADAAVP